MRCGVHLMHIDAIESVGVGNDVLVLVETWVDDDEVVRVEADMGSNDAAASCSLDVCWGDEEVVVFAESSLQGLVLDFLA